MNISYDLHIHTALSPCGSNDMTPNNIINMALLKELDVIAIADHNSSENCIAAVKAAENKGIVVIPGIELQTTEEVHLLCFFNNIYDLAEFQQIIDNRMIKVPNNPLIFGEQLIIDHNDCITGEKEIMLLSSSGLSINEAVKKVSSLGGVTIPSHIDRNHNSIIMNLGFIPEALNFKVLEVSRKEDLENLKQKYPFLNQYQFIYNSDAHDLGCISEREQFIEVEEKTIENILTVLKNGKGVII